MYKKILVATDGSALSDLAVAHAVALAAALNAALVIVTASERFHLFSTEADQIADTEAEYRRQTGRKAEAVLSRAAGTAAAAGVEAKRVHVEDDQPFHGIIATAEAEGCDLIVMASHGRRGLSAVVLGSETTKVLTHSGLPVLVVREEMAPAVQATPAGSVEWPEPSPAFLAPGR